MGVRRNTILITVVVGLGHPTSRSVAAPAGFAFLEVPAGARGSAVGGAYASWAQGVEALFWNPAGLAAVEGIQVTGSHYEFFQRLRHDQFAVAGRLLGGGLSAGVRALYSEAVVERDELGNEIGTFGGHDLEFSLGYGYAPSSGLRIGTSGQIVRDVIAQSAATTYSFGGGASWTPLPRLQTGLTVEHLGPAATHRIDGERGRPLLLPTALQTGVSYGIDGPGHLGLQGAIEGRFTRGRSGVALLGVEFAGPSGASLRLGFRANDETARFSVGAGGTVGSLHLDYAYVPYELDLGDTHRLSFVAQF
ncbi:MAG TPA: PorV/PorQ family protein [Candidatus Eisenbacteria bacterium]